MSMVITENQIQRLKNQYEGIAQQELEIKFNGTFIYCYGTEIACLRLFHAFYRSADECMARVSHNEESGWSYSFEPDFFRN